MRSKLKSLAEYNIIPITTSSKAYKVRAKTNNNVFLIMAIIPHVVTCYKLLIFIIHYKNSLVTKRIQNRPLEAAVSTYSAYDKN